MLFNIIPRKKIDNSQPPNLKHSERMSKRFKYTKNDAGAFICPHCPYTNANQSSMHYHLKAHLDVKDYKCEHCDQKYPQKQLLELHMLRRHADKPDVEQLKKKVFKCPCCDYKDIQKSNRLIHFLRVHMKPLVQKLIQPSKEEGCVAKCSECNRDCKSMTQFYYHAASCVKVEPGHTMAVSWKEIQ